MKKTPAIRSSPSEAGQDYLARRLELFPVTARLVDISGSQELEVGGSRLGDLAVRFGTPLYVYDQATLDSALQDYRHALYESYPGQSGVTYAAKAFLCTAVAQWAHRQGLWIDCSGEGELYIARSAGVPRQNLLLHGVNKSQADLQAAFSSAGTIAVDNLAELERLKALVHAGTGPPPDIWLRICPNIPVTTHRYTQTGQEDSKFGLPEASLPAAVQSCLQTGLPLVGVHFHQGSQFHNPSPVGEAVDRLLDLLGPIRAATGWFPQVISPGGGWGVAYHEGDLPHPSSAAYVQAIAQRLKDGCTRRGLPFPRLQLEPGRSLIARAGVAIYQVGSVKRTAHRRWLLLDGGLADNPRPALYEADYSALPVVNPQRPLSDPAWLAGPYCESGDVLIEDLPLPEIQPGEWVAVPVSGAYQLSMSSNYNGARRPAVVWLDQGGAHLIQRRESLDDLLRRDVPV